MEQTTLTLCDIMENGVTIFDFDYPFYNEQYRTTFQENFTAHFYYDEIGHETVARFKHRLEHKLKMIMPYWNKILLADNLEQRILDNYDITENFTKNATNTTDSTSENVIASTTDSVNKNLESDTPVTKVDFDQIDYFSNIVKDIGNSTADTTANGTNNVSDVNTETWTRTMTGNMGVQTDSDSIVKYWESLRQIEKEIFEQCSDLFMGVY